MDTRFNLRNQKFEEYELDKCKKKGEKGNVEGKSKGNLKFKGNFLTKTLSKIK